MITIATVWRSSGGAPFRNSYFLQNELWNRAFRNSFHTSTPQIANHFKSFQILYKSKNASYIPQIRYFWKFTESKLSQKWNHITRS